jgi:hypothetical protein
MTTSVPGTPQMKTPQSQGTSTGGFRTNIAAAFRGEFAIHVHPHRVSVGGTAPEKV